VAEGGCPHQGRIWQADAGAAGPESGVPQGIPAGAEPGTQEDDGPAGACRGLRAAALCPGHRSGDGHEPAGRGILDRRAERPGTGPGLFRGLPEDEKEPGDHQGRKETGQPDSVCAEDQGKICYRNSEMTVLG